MNKPWLESRLSANPNSPFFARLASCYLKEGRTMQAVELCLQGLRVFPEYATGHLVLGKCYEALGRNVEGMLEYRKALRLVPDNPTIRDLLRTVEQREHEAFKAFTEERARKLRERKDALTFDSFLADSPDKESTIDFVLRRLNQAKKLTPISVPAAGKTTEPQPAPKQSGAKIVTATLAEIYAKQGEYGEAIDAYKKLLLEHPAESKRYEKRIAQLEELSKLQHIEQKS